MNVKVFSAAGSWKAVGGIFKKAWSSYIHAVDKRIPSVIIILLNACVLWSVPSQVVLSRTLNKKQMLMSVATKIAIQLNCKMGGEVWALEVPVRLLLLLLLFCIIITTKIRLSTATGRETETHRHISHLDSCNLDYVTWADKYLCSITHLWTGC